MKSFSYFFSGQLLPTVLKSKAWGILLTLAEMFSYRLHHIQPHYRVHLVHNLHSLLMVPFTEKRQIHLWYVCICVIPRETLDKLVRCAYLYLYYKLSPLKFCTIIRLVILIFSRQQKWTFRMKLLGISRTSKHSTF